MSFNDLEASRSFTSAEVRNYESHSEKLIDVTGLASIRISEIKIHFLAAPLKDRFGWSLGWATQRVATVVEVRTDVGLVGWGEGQCDLEVLYKHADDVIGRSPFEVESIYQLLRRPGPPQGRPGPAAAPGLDIALWDLIGKVTGKPVCALIGYPYRTEVQPYITALYRKDWPDLTEGLVTEACNWVKQGYSMLKMKIGYSPEMDVKAVREAIGSDVRLAVDANCAYDFATALRLGKKLEDFDLAWFEEPLLADDFTGYQRLRQLLSIPLAAGETGTLEWLTTHYIQSRLVDILQPDIEFVGFTGARLLTFLCHLNHTRLIPHNWGTALRTAATLHWISTIPPLTPAASGVEPMLEFDQTEHPFRDAIVSKPIAPRTPGGPIPVPQGPGLGVTVIPEALERYIQKTIQIPAR